MEKRVIAVNRSEYEENARQEKLDADMKRFRKRSLRMQSRELSKLDNKMRRKSSPRKRKD